MSQNYKSEAFNKNKKHEDNDNITTNSCVIFFDQMQLIIAGSNYSIDTIVLGIDPYFLVDHIISDFSNKSDDILISILNSCICSKIISSTFYLIQVLKRLVKIGYPGFFKVFTETNANNYISSVLVENSYGFSKEVIIEFAHIYCSLPNIEIDACSFFLKLAEIDMKVASVSVIRALLLFGLSLMKSFPEYDLVKSVITFSYCLLDFPKKEYLNEVFDCLCYPLEEYPNDLKEDILNFYPENIIPKLNDDKNWSESTKRINLVSRVFYILMPRRFECQCALLEKIAKTVEYPDNFSQFFNLNYVISILGEVLLCNYSHLNNVIEEKRILTLLFGLNKVIRFLQKSNVCSYICKHIVANPGIYQDKLVHLALEALMSLNEGFEGSVFKSLCALIDYNITSGNSTNSKIIFEFLNSVDDSLKETETFGILYNRFITETET